MCQVVSPTQVVNMKTLDLSGIWQCRLDREKEGVEAGFEKGGYDDIITLPGTTSMAKMGEPNPARETGFLTDAYAFEGYVWFAKEIQLSPDDLGQPIKLYLERTRITRVWVDGVEVTGAAVQNADSLCAPHIYDLTDYIENEIVLLTIMVSNTDYPTRGGHMTSPDTQSNWNGITGRMELQVYDEEILEQIRVDTDIKKGIVSLCMDWKNSADITGGLSLKFVINRIALDEGGEVVCTAYEPSRDGTTLAEQICSILLPAGNSSHTFRYDLGDNFTLWSEYSPVIYQVDVFGTEETYYGSASFGMRELHTDEHFFYINGQKTFLRGKHDGMIFPLTGAAPTDLSEWLRVMGTAKRYGINHYRYHTSCPPEAAFTAADLLGIYMEPELPFWGTIAAPGEEGYNEEEQHYLIQEGKRIQQAFGNHPSFCMMSLGNELWGSSARLGEILRGYKEKDQRHLYTQGSNNFQFVPCILPEDDFYVGVRFGVGQLIRGSYAMCDAPQGFVQTDKPNTVHAYDDEFLPYLAAGANGSTVAPGEEIEIQYGTGTKKVKATDAAGFAPTKPVVSHEIGQYCTFPNFKEIQKYTGVLQPRNLEVFRERMQEAGLLELAEDYFEASGKLAVQCYKLELEAAHRSRYLAGYQILDIQDFNGQGTALVGILDSFMESKGLVTEEAWRGFCSDAVLMASFQDFVLESGRTFQAEILLSCFRPELIGNNAPTSVTWKVYEQGRLSIDYNEVNEILVASGKLSAYIAEAGVTEFGQIELGVPEVSMPERWRLVLELETGTVKNEYMLTVFPRKEQHWDVLAETAEKYVIAGNLQEAVKELSAGKDVVLFSETDKEYIRGFYCTEFWNYPMFRDISDWMKKERPVGTMGLLIDDAHPALSLFPSKRYATPQWYELVTDAHLHILDEAPKNLRPIVSMMDNFERSHRLGFLWEASVAGQRLLVCAKPMEKLMESAEGVQFVKSILCYAATEEFAPRAELSMEELEQLI
jgi:hypothetical protein